MFLGGYSESLIICRIAHFLARFGWMSGEFVRAMVRLLARRNRPKITMARPNEPNLPLRRTKNFEKTGNSGFILENQKF